MATLVVIPARMGSRRFPGKPLADLAGKTLIQRVCERAARLPGVAGPRVATDDAAIRDHVRSLGFEAVMTRSDHPSGTDRVAEAAGDWPGLVLNLQGDEPLFELAAVARLVARLEADPALPLGTAAAPLAPGDREDPDRVKVLRGPDGRARDFARRLAGAPSADVEVLRHAGVYLFRAAALRRFVAAPPAPRERAERLEQLRALHLGLPIWVERAADWAPGVDRPADLKVVAKRLRGG